MHHHYPDTQVLLSPHSRGHQQQAETHEQDGNSTQQHDAHQIDEYELDVGLAGALQ